MAVGFLKQAKSFLPEETLQTLCKSVQVLWSLAFDTAALSWGCAGSSEINQLRKLQKRAATGVDPYRS